MAHWKSPTCPPPAQTSNPPDDLNRNSLIKGYIIRISRSPNPPESNYSAMGTAEVPINPHLRWKNCLPGFLESVTKFGTAHHH